MNQRVVPVGLLTSYVRQLFETDALLSDIWIEGEVSDSFVSRAGHVYFTLAGDGCFIKCVLFAGMARRQQLMPRPGDHLAAHGRVSIYERDGTYQLYVDVVQHAGVGINALLLEQLRQRLEAEGLFAETRKRPIPTAPRWIGVVTSAEGAVWHDIQTVLRRRFPLTHLLLAAAPVQGENAPDGLVSAFELLRRDGRAEVVILARGGGSADDLACFNDERVVRAAFACPVPVVSAIGHETDWTLVDLVADLRAPTPSAAAELCSPLIDDLIEDVEDARDALRTSIQNLLRAASDLSAVSRAALARQTPAPAIAAQRAAVGGLRATAGAFAETRIEADDRMLGQVAHALASGIERDMADRRHTTGRAVAVLQALSPRDVLNRGYALVERAAGGEPVYSVHALATGDRIVARFRDGQRQAIVASS